MDPEYFSFENEDELRNAPTPNLLNNYQHFDDVLGDSLLGFNTYETIADLNGLSASLPVNVETYQPLPITYEPTVEPEMASSSSNSFTSSDCFTHSQQMLTYDSKNAGKADLAKRKNKCMTKNAIAARENRERKKLEKEAVLKNYQKSQKEASEWKYKYEELNNKHQQLLERNVYLESIISNVPHILSIMNHLKMSPKVSNSINQHNVIPSDVMQKLYYDKKITNSGICLHIRGPEDISLHFCHMCSSKHKEGTKT